MFHSSQAKHVPLQLSETCFHLVKRNMLDCFEAKHDRIMNPQETQQVAARDEKWVPSAERYTIKKVQDTDSYEFLLANKKYIVNAEVFRTILDICPRVEGLDIADVPDDDTALTFLIDLSYKAIINKCLSGKLASNDKLRKSRIDILWGVFNRENVDYPKLIWEDLLTRLTIGKKRDQDEYGLPIPDMMLTDAINRSESYQMFIKYSTNQIPPKKSRAKKKTTSRRVVKKKVTLSADDNIISDDLDAALELAKPISQTEAEEAEAARKVHATHARIMTESVSESTKKKSGGRSSKSIVIQDTPSAPKSKPVTLKAKLKGAPSVAPVEQEPANIMQALEESKKTRRGQPGTGGSNEGTSSKPGVPDESTVISATSSEGTGTKPGVPDEDKDIIEEKDGKDGDADNKGDDHVSDTQDANDEDVEINLSPSKEGRNNMTRTAAIKARGSLFIIPPRKQRERFKRQRLPSLPDDNIISDDPDAALELAKSISQTEVEEAEAARKVHATHARIVSEYGGRSFKSVVIEDTPSTLKSKSATSKAKLKGAPSLTPAKQEAANIRQALKESKKTSKRNQKVILEWGDEQDSEHSDDDNDDAEKDEKDDEADDEGDENVSDTQDTDDEDVETESDEDDIYKYKIRVRKDEDITDAEKEEAEKTSEAKDDTKKTELPPSISSLSVSSGFGDQFLKLSSDSSLVSTVKDSTDADVSSLLDIPIQHETPQIQSPSV
ncbi:hypothetical protein Tco_1476027 [Tanacetum coccineum]